MEIEIGDYVRTKDGYIAKAVERDTTNWLYFDNSIMELGDDKFSNLNELEQKERVIAHSKNIIDLLEEGDFVNGYYCRYITDINTGEKHLCNYDLNVMQWIPLKDIDVLGEILTKEQYEKNCYVVGE